MAKKKTVKKKTKKTIRRDKNFTKPSEKKTPTNKVVSTVNDKKVVLSPMPTAGRKIAEFEDQLDKQLGENAPAKRGRGRPRKDEMPQPEEIDISVIGQAIKIPFDLWSISQGVPELKITANESIMIAKPLKQLLDHYIPQVPTIVWAWISLGAVSYSIMKSRLVLIAEIKKKNPNSEQRTDAARGKTPHAPKPQGQGGSHPSGVFPTADQIKNLET